MKGEKKGQPIRGTGRVFKRGTAYWISYYFRGHEYRESSHSVNENDAVKLLRKRLGQVGNSRLTVNEEKITFAEMAEDFKRDYEVNKRRSLRSAKLCVSHLEKFFKFYRALDITTDKVRQYVSQRQGEGAANASINRELSALKRMFSLYVEAGRLTHKPYIPMLDENNARQGFLCHADFMSLRGKLPDYLHDPVTFLYRSGWRVSEMKALEWRDVDMSGRVVRLRPEISKNKKGRVLPLRGELLSVLERARERRRLDCVRVFHCNGKPVGDFRKAWRNACKDAKLGHILVHDLRRTAVRNLVKSGVPDKVAMELSGHKTRSVFDRYAIVNDDDLADAVDRVEAHLEVVGTGTGVASVKA
jgi:integrase